MKALITGGTSGIGLVMADELLQKDYDVILVSRHYGDTQLLKDKYPSKSIEFFKCDLSKEEECHHLIGTYPDIDVFINNAGFGDIGFITKTSLDKEVDMVKVNDIATLILVKSYLLKFIKKDRGRVLMVASAASFGVAPYMNVYYATKSFVYSLAHGYYRELKNMKSHVTVSVLCPGPVKTNFEQVANAKFNTGYISKEKCAKVAIKKFLKGKFCIVPTIKIKLAHLFSHFVPKKFISFTLKKQSEIKD